MKIDYTDPEYLRKRYHEDGWTLQQIAEEAGVCDSTVLRYMDNHDIERRDMAIAVRNEYVRFDMNARGYEYWRDCRDGAAERPQVYVHRLLAVAEYGFEAVADRHIHHVNGIPWDNRPENIEPIGPSQHKKLHSEQRYGDAPWRDRELLEELYQTNSPREIATILSCDKTTVYRWLDAFDIGDYNFAPERVPDVTPAEDDDDDGSSAAVLVPDGGYSRGGTDQSDLFFADGMHFGKLMATNIGEEVWIPVTAVRNGAFRAVKVEIKDRASVGGYEEKHAIEDWEGDAERLYNRSIETGTDHEPVTDGGRETVRPTIRLPSELLADLETLVEVDHFMSRGEAIRSAIRRHAILPDRPELTESSPRDYDEKVTLRMPAGMWNALGETGAANRSIAIRASIRAEVSRRPVLTDGSGLQCDLCGLGHATIAGVLQCCSGRLEGGMSDV